MQPLSPRIRRLYLFSFITLFFAILPIIILFADGWRYKQGFGLVRTGGVYVAVPYPDAEVSLNGETVGRSGFFDRSFYVGNLAPAAYSLEVSREGYLPWNRVVVVEPQLVSDAEALLFPKRIEPVQLSVTGTATTGVSIVSRDQYDAYLDAFATTTLPGTVAGTATSTPIDVLGDIGIFVRNGDVFARWMSDDAFPSSRFCGRPSFCVREFAIERGAESTHIAQLFRGGVAYATDDGIYFAEIDIRPTPVNVQLFQGKADMRVIDEELIVKVDDVLYQISI